MILRPLSATCRGGWHPDYDEEDVMANCKDSFDYTDNYWKDNFEDEDDVEDFLTRDWDD